MKKWRIVILFSGEGSNMESIIKKLHNKNHDGIEVEVVATISNNPEANGIARSERLGVAAHVINHKDFSSRELFDQALLGVIKPYNPDIVVLAGFMRILTPHFTQEFFALNIHPSLLPLFKGAHAMRASYDSPMKVAGVSVHRVSAELDGGEIIAQEAIKKIEGESFECFSERIHALEHRLYPETILKVLRDFSLKKDTHL